MPLIEEFGYTVEEGREEAFQEWLRTNERKFREAHPPGIRYLGTFGVVFSSEKKAGTYRTLLELDGYASLDAMSEAVKDSASDFGRLVREHSSFMAFDPQMPWSNSLYRSVVDMAVFDSPAPGQD